MDQDFNFITGIERRLERAEVDAEGRGIELTARRIGVHNGAHQYSKGEAALMKAVERTGAIVDRAPKGMSRNRVNRTRWLQKYVDGREAVVWREVY